MRLEDAMKRSALVVTILIGILAAGCAIGPTRSVVINPFDWSTADAGPKAPPPIPAVADAR